MTEIGLVRHFPTDWNRDRRLQGRADTPLSAAARAELAALRLPASWRAARVVASPLLRAHETAEALAEGPVASDPRLIEMDFGDWEGRFGPELLADPACAYRPVESWGWDFRPPGGETPAEVFARLAPLLAEIAAAGRPTLLVAHRGVMRTVLARATGWAYAGPEPFRIKRAAVHTVTLDAAGAPVAAHGFERLEAR